MTGKNWKNGLLAGTTLLFVSMTIVNGGNYLYNLILGRWLGPASFADLSLIITIMLMITFVTVTFQLTAAKFAAGYDAAGETGKIGQLQAWLGRAAWLGGGILMLIIAGGAPVWQKFFHMQTAWPFVILGLGLPVYFAQGVDRGILQGQMRFGRLALSYQAEMWVRLAVGLVLVALGWAVIGAVLGIALSFAATWLVVRGRNGRPAQTSLAPVEKQAIIAFAGPVILVNLSQILINNSDILIVKRFFAAEQAGQYAALALVGRIVFFATWSVVTTLFPLVAQKHQRGESHRHLLGTGLGLVTLVSASIILAAYLIPRPIILVLFGAEYLAIAPLLWLYATATGLYALANVVINYRLSLNHGRGSWLALAGGAVQVVGLTLFHNSLYQVVMIQIVLMGGLLASLLAWDLWLAGSEKRNRSGVKKLEDLLSHSH